MDHDRFDDLTRALASTTSRRTVLKTLAGSAAGGLLAMLGVGDTAAAPVGCKASGKSCKRGDQCCSGVCVNGVCVTPPSCGHSAGLNGGCKGACTSAGFTSSECGPICGSGEFVGFCPVDQGGGDPCCNVGLCNPDNFERIEGIVTYVGPTAGC